MSLFRLAAALSALCIAAIPAVAFDNSRSDNLAVYWGQNSYGATHSSDVANWQKPIDYYCQDDTINAIPIAFLNVFQSTGGFPSINLASTCNTDDNGVFAGTSLPNCTFLASAIEYCQSRGKIVTISLGGATGAASFTSADQATAFGDTIWDLFLGGDSQFRPFGGAVLDGIDLDIEGGNTVFFDSFIGRIRQLASIAGGKRYYVTAAPQCPYPDAYLGTVLNLASFDAVYVQFYNNWCGLQNYNNIWAWDFASWDTWAKSTSVNPNVKIYIGAPASSTAAGSGYVDATTLGNIAIQQRGNYSSFGGVMLWDASQAYANNRYDQQVKNLIRLGNGGSTTSNPVTVPTIGSSTSTRSSSTTTRTTGTSTRTRSSTRTSSTGTATPSCTCTCTCSPSTPTLPSTPTSATGTSTRSSTRTSATGTSTRSSTDTSATETSTRTSTLSSGAGTSTLSSTQTSDTGTSTYSSTGTSATGTSTRTTSTSRSSSSTRASSTSTRASSTSTRASSTSTRASSTSTRASSTSTRASSTSTKASTTSTRASTTTARTSTTTTRRSTSTRATTTTSRTASRTSTVTSTRTTSSSAPGSTSGSCSAPAWSSSTTYVGGNQVSYNGHLWTAKWWSYNDVPGGPAGVWADNGPC